ncbi:MAG: indolepyruvate oxidoreductase subunit beta [Clostridia bacterium]|nr:indolepyruvate oxidoreductase subunit beta [Clostridia bacterium]
MKYDILITGVGGQGQVLASRLLGAAAILAGFSARTGETIGMAQRGGSVVSNVRIGDEAMSPAVPLLGADLIIGFEICETARVLGRLKPGGCVILNDQVIRPVTVSLGLQRYDRDAMLAAIRTRAGRLIIVDAVPLAQAAGAAKAVNTVLLGAAAGTGLLPLPLSALNAALKANLPEKYLEPNLRAFESGYRFTGECVQ